MTKTEVRKLTAKWYKRLARKGFVDLEDERGNLKEYHSLSFNRKRTKIAFDEKQRYYELARQLLHSYPFPDRECKLVWHLHSEGHVASEIVKHVKWSEPSVERYIKRLEWLIKNDGN